MGFAETVLHKLPSKGPRANPDGNMGTKWLGGVFVGFGRSSNSYVIATDDGVVAARTIYRRPLENRWKPERIARMTATPWSTREKSDVTVSFKDAPSEEEKAVKRIEGVPKASRINYSDPVSHGFTDGCLQCEHNSRTTRSKGGISHTEAFRTRMLDALTALTMPHR